MKQKRDERTTMKKKQKKSKRPGSILEEVIYLHESGEDQKGGYPFRLVGAFILDFLHFLWILIKWPIIVITTIGILGCVVVFVRYGKEINQYRVYADKAVNDSTKNTFKKNETTYIYDDSKTTIAKLSENGDSTYLAYSDIPKDAVNAFIAVEDRDFWNNIGVDFKGILRVSVDYVFSRGDDVAGASTITQQLARMTFLTREVSIERKVKEMMISIRMTQKYTKEQIMEFYVNDAYFNNGNYGLEAAAQAYFGVSAKELDLSQITYLCAIPNRPTYYDPYDHPSRALTRRDKILKDMYEMKAITKSEYEKAVTETLTVRTQKQSTQFFNYETTYAVHCAVEYLMKQDGFHFKYEFSTDSAYKKYQKQYEEQYELERNALYSNGYKIYTSLNSNAQDSLQSELDDKLSFDSEVDAKSGIYKLQGAMTAIDNSTGKVIAIIGGRSQSALDSTYSLNRAFQSYRQPGSSIKPIAVYTPAFMKDYTPDTIVNSIDVKAANKRGADVSKLTGASMTVRNAVVNSINGAAYQVFYKITPDYGLSFLSSMKFDKIVPSDHTLSAALGGLTYGVTTVQMASAYTTFVNQGDFRQPTCLVSMQNDDGDELYKETASTPVYTSDASAEMIDVLKGVLTSGTAKSIKWSADSKIAAAGKTGTTNDSKDGWFCGFTPYYTISVWVGYDTPKTLDSLHGGTYPAQIWKQSMLDLTKGDDAVDFTTSSSSDSSDSSTEAN